MGTVSNVVHVIVMSVAALLWMIFMGRECLDDSNDNASLQSV
jgi:hypothetical protein